MVGGRPGGTGVSIKPFIGSPLGNSPAVPIHRRAAIAFGHKVVCNTGFLPGRTMSAGYEAGIPCMHGHPSPRPLDFGGVGVRWS